MASANQINKHIDAFTEMWKDGEEVNPMPEGVKLTVYCDNGDDEVGFAENSTSSELGITALIARKWILQSDLDALLAK